jgi:hypothetical protein
MNKSSELEDLARRYLELWQDQATAMAADPAMLETLGRLAQFAWPPGLNPLSRGTGDGARQKIADGSASGVAASRSAQRDLKRILDRLGAIERRLERLETALAVGKGRRSRPRATRARTAEG